MVLRPVDLVASVLEVVEQRSSFVWLAGLLVADPQMLVDEQPVLFLREQKAVFQRVVDLQEEVRQAGDLREEEQQVVDQRVAPLEAQVDEESPKQTGEVDEELKEEALVIRPYFSSPVKQLLAPCLGLSFGVFPLAGDQDPLRLAS